jgi:hypothetical protein
MNLKIHNHLRQMFPSKFSNQGARMSKEAVGAFIEGIAKDPKLQQELAELAAKYGYDFTADELNDSDLSGIVGGGMDILSDADFAAKKKPAKK